jgi:hypothetical protein
MCKQCVIAAVLFASLWPVPDTAYAKKADLASLRAGSALVEAKLFPFKGPTEGLQPQILDFRYAPQRWQVCIGLPDDPHKSIVGSDGGLYYNYGAGKFYGFGTRVLADLETQSTGRLTAGPKSKIKQSLRDPRIPIVITEQNIGDLTLRQEAWAGAPYAENISQWSSRRVDYLWLKMVNNSTRPQTGRIVVQIDSKDSLVLNDGKNRLFERGNSKKNVMYALPCLLCVLAARLIGKLCFRDRYQGRPSTRNQQRLGPAKCSL